MPTKAIEICIAVANAGGTAYFTGGGVRDLLMGRKCSDIDLEVFSLSSEALETILEDTCEKVNYVGKSYGIYKADGIDVGLARRDLGHGKSAEVAVDGTEDGISIKEAAVRRDITCNALYLNPFTLHIHDLFGGRNSINNKVIRHVNDETFQEDPLRTLRVARFAATLGFDVDYNTLTLCRRVDVDKVRGLPKERVMGELTKALLDADKPSVFFQTLIQVNLMSVLFPEVFDSRLVEQGKMYHPEGSVFNHTMLAIDSVPKEVRTLEIMLALLFHDLGKSLVPAVATGEKISFHGHAEETANAQAALLRLTNEIGITDSVLNLVKHHMSPYNFKGAGFTRKQVRKLAAKVDMRKLMVVHKADRDGRGYSEENASHVENNIATAAQIMAVFEEIEGEILPVVTGRHLISAGFTPGKHFGMILKELYDRQLEEQFTDITGGLKIANILFGNIKGGDRC